MPTNEVRRELLDRAKASGYPGSIVDVFQAADQGIDLIEQHQMQQQKQEMMVAQTPQEQEVGLREQHAMGNTQASMAFPNVQPNQSFNTVGMRAPIDIQKIDNQGHLVESYKNVPPGIQDLPTGPSEGTVIESPAAYQKGGFNFNKTNTYNKTIDYSSKAIKARQQPVDWDKVETFFNFVPYTGEVIDAKNTIEDLKKGDYSGAALNAAGFLLPFVPGAILKKGARAVKRWARNFKKNKIGEHSKANFLENVKSEVKGEAKSGLGYYRRYKTFGDINLTQKNLSSHLDKMGKSGKTTLYRYGDNPTGPTGNWYSADPMDPFRYQDMTAGTKRPLDGKVFKIEVDNDLLSSMYVGGPQQEASRTALTKFKEFDVPEGFIYLGNKKTYNNLNEYTKYLNTLKQTGGFKPFDFQSILTEEQRMPYDELLRRQRFQESSFNPKSVSPKGAKGVAQFTPITLQEMKRLGFADKNTTMKDLEDPNLSRKLQRNYMDYISKKSWIKGNDQVKRAKTLIAYNYGPDRTRKKLNKLKAKGVDIDDISFINYFNKESRDYVGRILLNEGDFEKQYTEGLLDNLLIVKRKGGLKNTIKELQEKAESIKEVYDNITNPRIINTKNLRLDAKIDPMKQSLAFNTKLIPTKRTTVTGGVTYIPGSTPKYTAGLTYRLKHGGLKKCRYGC
tara:strand:+ start:2586 stop:4610 length:2025 start_codon:yes stop_codon:yes gene_type:complete